MGISRVTVAVACAALLLTAACTTTGASGSDSAASEDTATQTIDIAEFDIDADATFSVEAPVEAKLPIEPPPKDCSPNATTPSGLTAPPGDCTFTATDASDNLAFYCTTVQEWRTDEWPSKTADAYVTWFEENGWRNVKKRPKQTNRPAYSVTARRSGDRALITTLSAPNNCPRAASSALQVCVVPFEAGKKTKFNKVTSFCLARP